MSRSPLPAWRRLFAAGGAPLAAHAALSRAPAPERLLEPMARMRLAAETSLDALARPLDISGVLARVLEGMPVAQNKSVEESDTPERVRNGAHRGDALKRVSRARPQTRAAATSVHNDNELHPMPPAPRKRMLASPNVVSRAIPQWSSTRGKTSPSNEPPQTASAQTTVPFERQSATIDAHPAGNTRVIVDAPVEGIDRLLAIGNLSAIPTGTRRSTARANGPAMEPSASDCSTARSPAAVDRVAARRATMASPVHHETLITERQPTDGNRAAENVTAIVNDAPSNGGFRGLARRTLVTNGGAAHFYSVRIELGDAHAVRPSARHARRACGREPRPDSRA